MPDNCVETACSSCCHLPVCCFKEEFLEAQKAVNNVWVSKKKENKCIKLTDIPYIKPVILHCKNYLEKSINFRSL